MSDVYCFSILALMPKYQALAKQFAEDLDRYFPGVTVVIGTDNPDAFRDCRNVSPFRLYRRGILHCYHDKRFVIGKALTQYKTVIQIDADTRIRGSLSEAIAPKGDSFCIDRTPGIAAIHLENLVEHAQKYSPQRLIHLTQLADKLQIDLDEVSFVGESLFAVSAAHDQATEFIQQWNRIARYLELRGIHAGEGNAIGLAAAKAELPISKPAWLEQVNQIRQHLDATYGKPKKPQTRWQQFKSKADYHYRFNKARAIALKEFDFYYR